MDGKSNLKTLSSTKQKMAQNFTEIVRDLFCGAVRPKSAKNPPNERLFEKTRGSFEPGRDPPNGKLFEKTRGSFEPGRESVVVCGR